MRRLQGLAFLAGLLGVPMVAAAQQPPTVFAARTVNPHGSSLKEACSSCHAPSGWTPVRIAKTFKHAQKTFPLDGAHAGATCASCHKTLDFQKTATTCASCHRDVHKGELGTDCAKCHTSRAFVDRSSMTRMHQLTRFPLRSAHAVVACESCHLPTRAGQMQFVRGSTACASCHAATFRSAVAPPHVEPSFSMNCTSCHTSASWKGAQFDHALTLFPLTGGHKSAACADCHADKQYHGRSMECSSCHEKDYAGTTNPPHAQGFPTTCTSCHNTTTWSDARFDHSQMTRFALTGAHRTVTCAGCHGDKVFRGKAQECVACHKGAYDQAVTPKHAAAGFSTTCTTCHTTAQWKGAQFDHNSATRFALSGAHRTTTCAQCHGDDVYRGKPTTCLSCHQSVYASTQAPPHAAANFATTCQSCHTTTQWKGAQFDHAVTKFPLTGAHRVAVCANCHGDNVYVGKPTTCVSCHQTQYNGTKTPPHGAAGFTTVCQSCHTTTQWAGAPFDHGTTQFALTGAHRAATCANCHGDGVYRGKPGTCASCHQAKYAATAKPPHASAGFPTTCQTCHSTTQWEGAVFDHNATQFALTGAHKAATCANCHADQVYAGKPTTCLSCHQSDYNGTANPNHKASGFTTTCQTCHTTTQWRGAGFNHDLTKFPLTGSHKVATCNDCHSDNVYAGKPTTCVSCHQSDYNGTTTPNHKTSGFPTTCETCHQTAQWTGAPFDHNKTLFPLTGAHKTSTCTDCHSDGVYKGKPTACASCHQAEFNATTRPNHRTSGLSTACASCHTTAQWLGATFDHSKTLFPLTGAHKTSTCNDCHANGVYKGKPIACVSCHQTDYNGTTTPNHKTAGFPTACEACHTTAQWQGAVFNHNATLFPLTGAHQAATCTNCHGNGVYKGLPTACASCHQADFNSTTRPPHGPSNISTLCQSCHTTVQWMGGTYNHNVTQFPLTGAHQAATCNDCHANGVYKGKPTTCLTCHNTDWSASTNPHHSAAGFVTTCQTCHTTVQWKGGTYNHNVTAFPLTGAHVQQQCISCHATKVYKGLPATCVSCHLADYNATTNPKHSTAMFPTACQGCHTTTQWQGATFNHDAAYFPIYSGKHRGEWTRCSDCHVNSSNYKVFECILCHEHSNKIKVDNDHKGKSGYAYTSLKCYACHPKGD